MALKLSNIEVEVRALLGDISSTGSDVFPSGANNVFILTEDNVISVTKVYVNNIQIGDSEFSYDSDINKCTIDSTLLSGDTVQIEYTHYPNYSSTEIENYIKAALIHISANNYKDFIESASYIFPEPSVREKNLISMVTALLINPDNKTYRLPDMTISGSKDLSTHEKIRRTIMIFKKNTHGIFSL